MVSKGIQASCLEISIYEYICKCMIMYHDRTCSAKSDVSELFYSPEKDEFVCWTTVLFM